MIKKLSLRARLFASYLLLLSVALGVITAALLLILNTRPAPPQQTYQRLATIAQSVPFREILAEATADGVTTPAERQQIVLSEFDQVADELGVRILLTDAGRSTVLFDSSDTLQPGQAIDLRGDAYAMPANRRYPGRMELLFGSFSDSTGDWLFAGLALQPVRGAPATALLFADPPESQSLQQALAEFSSALVLPLCQSAIVGLIVASVLAVVGTRSIARPLQQLAKASTDIAEGDYDQRVPVSGPPEMESVANAFNYMAEQVQSTQRAQQDFLANVSHDLKTPLTSIQGYSQAIMDGAAQNPVQAAAIIYEEAARLNRMVLELTDLARLQAGRLSMQTSPIDIGRITASVGQRLSIMAQEKGVALDVDAAPVPEIAGDGDRLAQVIMNLVSNAIKYTPGGGRVRAATRVNDGGVEVVVQDNGIGIPPDELPRIFERFYQIDKVRGPERGTGLGLAIVREIVQAHGGRINVASAGTGKGATFTVWLPSPQISTLVRRRT